MSAVRAEAGRTIGYSPPRALYIHVPVCVSKCSYCDFHSLPLAAVGEGKLPRIVDATIRRARNLAERFHASGMESVYIGGGTPSALPEELLRELLRGIGALAPGTSEWSVEANPESLDPSKLSIMLECGVGRISIGVQSLDEAELAILARPHDGTQALSALRLAVDSGLRVSADLMAGLPRAAGTGRASRLPESAARILDLGLEHLSVYDLVLEEGTGLAAAVGRGELELPEEDASLDDRAAVEELAASYGLRRYEISNFAKPGAECRHNLAYWNMESYIGAGPGAVSTLVTEAAGSPARAGLDGGSLRIEEARSLGFDPAGSEAIETAIAPREAAVETFIMAFRMDSGLDLAAFERRFGLDFRKLVPGTISSWSPRLIGSKGFLALDRRGSDLLNRFLVDCMAELDRTFPLSS